MITVHVHPHDVELHKEAMRRRMRWLRLKIEDLPPGKGGRQYDEAELAMLTFFARLVGLVDAPAERGPSDDGIACHDDRFEEPPVRSSRRAPGGVPSEPYGRRYMPPGGL